MADTAEVARRRRDEDEPRLVDEALAQELIARAQAEGVQLLPDRDERWRLLSAHRADDMLFLRYGLH